MRIRLTILFAMLMIGSIAIYAQYEPGVNTACTASMYWSGTGTPHCLLSSAEKQQLINGCARIERDTKPSHVGQTGKRCNTSLVQAGNHLIGCAYTGVSCAPAIPAAFQAQAKKDRVLQWLKPNERQLKALRTCTTKVTSTLPRGAFKRISKKITECVQQAKGKIEGFRAFELFHWKGLARKVGVCDATETSSSCHNPRYILCTSSNYPPECRNPW